MNNPSFPAVLSNVSGLISVGSSTRLARDELNSAMMMMDPDGDNEITFPEFERW